MRRYLVLVAVFVAGFALATLAQQSRDAVDVDPTNHNVVMENEHVRVFEVLAAPGAKSPMHSHRPLAAVSLNSARLRMTTPDKQTSILDLRPGQVLWMENAEHSWELLGGSLHIVAVEVKAARKAGAN